MGVSGNGKVREKELNVEDFDAIQASGMFEIHLKEGDSPSLRLVADENLHELIVAEVRGGTLEVHSRENISRAKELDLYITVPRLNGLDLSGAVSVQSEGFIPGDDLRIETSGAAEISLGVRVESVRMGLSGASEVNLSGTAERVSVSASGASEIHMYKLQARNVSLDLSGASEVRCYASETLDVDASGAADIRYRGNPKVQKSTSGAASVKQDQ